MGGRSLDISQRRHTDGQTHEKMLNITIRQIQIKTTIRYHLTPARMAVIKKSTNNKEGLWRMPDRVWRKGNPSTLLVGM